MLVLMLACVRCWVSGCALVCAVTMGEAAKPYICECAQVSRLVEVSHEMLVLMLACFFCFLPALCIFNPSENADSLWWLAHRWWKIKKRGHSVAVHMHFGAIVVILSILSFFSEQFCLCDLSLFVQAYVLTPAQVYPWTRSTEGWIFWLDDFSGQNQVIDHIYIYIYKNTKM